MHRQLTNLDDAIAQARIPRELPFLRAERASVHARLGYLDQARAEVIELRRLPEAGTSGVLSAWLWLTEGLIDYHECLNLRARDRVHRAVALASSLRAPRIQSLAAAWLAHFDFRAQDYSAMILHADMSLRQAAEGHHGARARASLVVAGAYHFAGREDLAQPWYGRARIHAAAEGDGATLSAVMYNMSVLRLIEVRLADVFGQRDEAAVRRALLGTESSVSLDHSLRTKALSHHPPMQRAQILTVCGDHAGALAVYDEHLAGALAEGLGGSECLFQADRAWCLHQLGRQEDSLTAARAADSALLVATEPEEQAITHAILGRVFALRGLDGPAQAHRQRAEQVHQSLNERCRMLQEQLQAARLERFLVSPQGGEA